MERSDATSCLLDAGHGMAHTSSDYGQIQVLLGDDLAVIVDGGLVLDAKGSSHVGGGVCHPAVEAGACHFGAEVVHKFDCTRGALKREERLKYEWGNPYGDRLT